MKTISLICPDTGDACSIYRAVGPYSRLEGVNVVPYAGKTGFFLWQAIMFADIVMLQRPHTEQTLHIAETVRASGKPLIIDWDDDLTAVPPWNPHYKNFKDCKPTLQQFCKLANVVTVSTEPLAAVIRDLGAADVRVIPNGIDDTWKRLPRLPRRRIAAWRGSNTHDADVEVGKQTFLDFKAKGYEIAFFGDPPRWAWELGEVRKFPVADYTNYICLLNSLAPEYLVVPLVDCAFNRSKSDVAAQEAWLVGAKLIHNNVGAFEGLPESGPIRWLSEVNPLRKKIIDELA